MAKIINLYCEKIKKCGRKINIMPEQIMSSSKQCPIFIEMTLLTRLTESLLVKRNVVRLNILIKKKIYSDDS